jgi:hypothetical protein
MNEEIKEIRFSEIIRVRGPAVEICSGLKR